MKTLSIAALVLAAATPVMAQDAPPGARATSCDADSFTAVRDDNGEILYWTNSTCESAGSDSGDMMSGGMNGGMSGGGMSGGGMSGGGMSGGEVSSM